MQLLPAFVGTPDMNRVYQCDALTLLRAMPSESVDMLLADIPYDEINHNDRLHERAKYANGPIRMLHKGAADKMTFDLLEFVTECYRVTKGFICIFCGTSQTGLIRNYFSERGCMTRHAVWEKTNPSPLHAQYIWLSSIENCIVARKSLSTFNGFYQSSVWRFPAGESDLHPTQKPVGLFQYLIETCTNEGDIICDPVVGSGTTAIAARSLKRNFIVGDLSLNYVAIARERLRMPFEGRQVAKSEPLDDLPLFAHKPALDAASA